MMTTTQIKANKMWTDVMKGQPVTFTSDEETRVISRHAATMDILDSKKEDLTGLIISGRAVDVYVQMETAKLLMQQITEAIEDFDDE